MVGSRSLPTLARAELLAYLAMHGARTSWHRIKWLADFAALAAQTHPGEIVAAHRRAAEAGAEEVLDSALILSAELFDTSIARAPLAPRIERRAHRLVHVALRELTAPHATTSRVRDAPRKLSRSTDTIRVARSWVGRTDEILWRLGDPGAWAGGRLSRWRRCMSPIFVLSRVGLRQLARWLPIRR